MSQLKLKTRLHREDIKGEWTYLVIRDAFKIFGSKTDIQVKGTIDNHPIEGTLQPHGDGSHRFAVDKEIRDTIGKAIGDAVEVIFENVDLLNPDADAWIPANSKSKKHAVATQKKKKKLFSRKKA